MFNLYRTCSSGDKSLRFREKNVPKKYIFPCSVCYYFLHRISNPDRDLLCWKGNFLSKIEVNVPPVNSSANTQRRDRMQLFLQPILHLVWSVNSVGSGVTLRACELLLETRWVLNHTVSFQNLFIFLVFLKFDFVFSELAAFS